MNTFFSTTTLVLTGTQVLLGFLVVAAILGVGIWMFKKHLNQQAQKIQGQHTTDSNSPTLRKYEEVDFHRYDSNITMVGTVSALVIVVIAFAWTQFTQQSIFGEPVAIASDVQMEVPITTSPPKSAPALPPPPTTSLEIEISKEPIPTPKPKQEIPDPVLPQDPANTGPNNPQPSPNPPTIKFIPPPPPEPKTANDDIIMIAEKMPLFPGCEQLSDDDYDVKKACADRSLMTFIHENISYPEQAREIGIEGVAVVSFVVYKDGSIKDYKLLKDPGAGLGREAIRVVKLMNQKKKIWTPGKQRGRAVNVRMNMPVRFKLK